MILSPFADMPPLPSLPSLPPLPPPVIDLALPPTKLWVPGDPITDAPNIRRIQGKALNVQPAHVIKLWRHRPKIFLTDLLDITLDPWQEEATESYINFLRTAVVANKGPGKTGWLAMMSLHFMSCHNRPKAAAISVTKDHLKDNLWAEILKWRSRSDTLIASLTDGSEKIARIGEERFSFLSARSYPKDADESQMASALAGLHEDNVAFFVDEAGKIPDSVLAVADAALSTEDSENHGQGHKRILVTANPEQPSGIIYRASLGQTVQEWNVLHVTGDPDDPKRSTRVSVAWAREQINTYGADHPWVQINVFGKYPKTSSEQLLSEHEISESMRRGITEAQVKNSQTRLGIDVARGGADSSVLFLRRGLLAYPPELVSSEVLGPELAGKAVFWARTHRVERIYVDMTGGYGSSVYDHLTTFNEVDVIGVSYQSSAHQKTLYANKRTENWVRMRDWVKKGGRLPNIPSLAVELQMPLLLWQNGKMALEPKAQIKKRLGRSPDSADALSQTFQDVEEFAADADFSSIPNNDPYRHLSDIEYAKMLKRKQQPGHLHDESQLDSYPKPSSNHKS